MVQRTVFSVLGVVALMLASANCDFNPTAPFAGFDGEQGATLNGRFQQSGVASMQRSLSETNSSQSTPGSAADTEALKVIVLDDEDNEMGRVNVKNGAFTLRGLPESFTLVFVDENGTQVGDAMDFDGVKPNQEIDITVAIEEGNVVLIEEKRTGIDHEGSQGVELEGEAFNIVSVGDPMTGSLDVDGQHVITRAGETSIREGNRSRTLDDLRDGDRVHVRGVFEGADVFAYEIKLQEVEEEDDTTPGTCNVPDPEKSGHILVCHKGNTLSISPDAWSGHRAHGDTCGPCN